MNDDQLLLEHLAATDACPPKAPLPEEAWTRDVALAEIERRVGMQTRERTQQVPPEYRTSRGWLVAAAAFIVVLAVGTATLFWLTRGGGPEVVDEPTTTMAPTTTTPTPTTAAPSPLSLPGAWQRVGASVMTPIVGIFDMTETASGLVAVGFDPGEEDFRQNGVILTSTDGVNWSRLAEDDPALNLGAVLIYGVTDGGPGLVAVGFGCEDDAEPCMGYPTVWTSGEGTSWDRSPADPDVFGESGALVDVVNTEHGLVAAGGFYTGDEEAPLMQPTVWLSPDGIEWERVWQGEAYDYSAATLITGFQALATSAEGHVVGVGTATDDQGDFVGAVWTSADGRSWERIDPNSPTFASNTDSDVAVQDVAWGPGGFVAVGSDGGTEIAIWHSPDGLTWTRADTADQPFEYIGTLSAVDTLGTGWIAAGPHGFSDPVGGTVTLWTSPDGLTWDRVHSIDPGYVMSIVSTETGVAVAGGMPGIDNYYAAIWAGPGFDPAAPPPDPGPTPPPVHDSGTGIGSLEGGITCDEIAELGFGYAEAVSYWLRHYLISDEYDVDIDGPPCSQSFSGDAVTEVFGEPSALSVRIVEDHPTGAFEATGPAVDAGLICASGTIEYDEPEEDPASLELVLWRWEDILTCDDGSGAFRIGVDEYIDIGGAMQGLWNIVSGTGAYEGLRGGGGTDSVFDSFDESYGRLWNRSEEG